MGAKIPHSVDKTRIDAYEFKDAKTTIVEALHFPAKDWPIEICCCRAVDRREGIEDVHFSIHDESAECSPELIVQKETIFRSEKRCNSCLAEKRSFVGAKLVHSNEA